MEAGKLDRRITIQRATVTRNAMNEEVETFAPLLTVWASARAVSDGERMQAGELTATRMMRFQIRWREDLRDIGAEEEVVFESRRFVIRAVKELGRREGIEITAEARAE